MAAGVATFALTLAGCTSNVSGVDGKLINDWPALPEAKVFAPDAGVCHERSYEETGRASSYRPVDCAGDHYGETVHVGEFTGKAAELTSPPDATAAVVAPAYAECDKAAKEFVGREWRDGRLTIDLALPSDAAWKGGARWYRCDLNELTTVTEDAKWVERKGSLKGDLPADLLLACFAESGVNGSVDKMPEIDCAKSHNAEYMGSFIAPDSKTYPKTDAEWDYFHGKCRDIMASFVGVSRSGTEKYGVISWPYSRDTWTGGDRGVRCFFWLDKKAMTGSAKGTAGKGIPT
jgi:hypothetical protein